MSTNEKKATLIETKLNSINYNLWYFSIKIVLEDEEQHDLEATDVPPEDCPFVVLNTARAKRIIFLNCTTEVQATLTSCETASEMWNYLYRLNSGQNISRKNRGIKRLATFGFKKPTVHENVLELENLVTTTVVAAGTENISINELGVHVLLNSLPSRFNAVRALLEAREQNLTLEEVTKALIAEEERIKAREDTQVLFAGSASTKRCQHNRPAHRCWTCDPNKHPSKATCKDCQKLGHYSKNSPKCDQNSQDYCLF